MNNTLKLLQEWQNWSYDKDRILEERAGNGGQEGQDLRPVPAASLHHKRGELRVR